MEANPYALKQILSPERRYVIPTFQRDYEWTQDGQWQLLFDDLEQVAERLEVARSMAEAAGQDPARAVQWRRPGVLVRRRNHHEQQVGPHPGGAQ